MHTSNTNQTETWLYTSISNCSDSSMKIKIIASTIYPSQPKSTVSLKLLMHHYAVSGKSF